MSQITLPELQSMIDSGSQIVWVGYISENIISIHINTNDTIKSKELDISKLEVPKDPYIIKHCEATTKPLQFVGITWQRRGWLRALRIASIYGINVGSRCRSGLGTVPTKVYSKCTMGYDIETSQNLVKQGGFPPTYSRITSIALWCTCGYCEAWTTIKHKKIDRLTYCKSSTHLVQLSIEAIKFHMPQWLVGYNCYQFDNCSLAYHCPISMLPIFKSINSGAKAVSRYAFYIDLPGINNVDLYCYLDKCLRRQYSALSLGTVAKHHSLGGKMQMPTTDGEDTLYQLVYYNINDSALTAQLWHVTGACEQIIGLCVASCAPIIDCVRYVTGTMSSCAVSSYCISNNMLMDWSECNLRIGYEGGTVLDPIKSVFKKVTVCDFSAMYPTIIQDIGISPENIEILSSCSASHEDKILWWTHKSTLACIKGKIIRYNSDTQCMTRDVLSYVTKLRSVYKKTNVPYSTALKVLANSLYGALGFASSPLHSPRCAATVTVAGRTALALAYTVFNNIGLTVVYGDTDSCFLTSGSKTSTYFNNDINKHIDTALSIFHRILYFTPFPNMRMEKEDEYKSILLVDKKHYAYADIDGNIKTKGLSETRKDRLGICRDMTGLIAKNILLTEDMEQTRKYIIKLIDGCYTATLSGTLDMYSISREVRHEGNSCYRFTDIHGDELNIPVTRADKTSFIAYDSSKVLKSLESDINRLCIPAGIGTAINLLKDAEL